MKLGSKSILWGLTAASAVFQLLMVDSADAAQQKQRRRAAATAGMAAGQSTQTSALDNIGATYYGNFYGTSIGKPDNNFPDEKGNPQEPVNLYSSAKLLYKFTPSISANVNPRWLLRPSRDTARFGAKTPDTFQMLDPRIGVKAAKAVEQNGFSMTPSLDVELGLTESSQAKGRTVAPRFVLEAGYEVPNSRWSLGTDMEARFYIHRGATNEDNTLATYFNGFTSYRISPKVSAKLLFEAETSIKDGKGAAANTLEYPTSPNVQPSIAWSITDSVELAPYLLMYTSNGISAKSTAMGFAFSASIL